MPIEILMPSIGASMSEGSIARWAKQEGDAVKKGEILLDIETDKALVEVESQHDGVLGKILVADGSHGVKVGTVIALLAVNGEVAGALAGALLAPQAPTAPVPICVPAALPAMVHAAAGGKERIFASPLARRIAASMHMDLTKISGSGPNGRILKADVESAARTVAPEAATKASVPAAAGAESAMWEDIPHSNMRRVIAQRLCEAKQSIPHFYLTIDCCVDALMAVRRQLDGQATENKPSVNDFIVKAAALAMKSVPGVNASWGEQAIRRHRSVDISVAVATPGGLVTPIVCNADEKSLGRISAEIKALAARAKEGRLRPEEFQGGGFTISNLGMFGVREFSAIINPPQACILAVGACEPRAVVRDGALTVATQMTCTLSVDHRVVDGALGAEFLAAFRYFIEAPLSMML